MRMLQIIHLYKLLSTINKIKNRVTFKIKTSYKSELLSKETMRLLGNTKKVIAKDKKKLKCAKIRNYRCNINALYHCQ